MSEYTVRIGAEWVYIPELEECAMWEEELDMWAKVGELA